MTSQREREEGRTPARANRRTAAILGLIALAIYAYYILRQMFLAGGASV